MSRHENSVALEVASALVGRPARLGGWVRRYVERISRYGHVIRGVIYLLPGALALQLAVGGHGAAINQTGAIRMIGEQPFGRVLLISVAVGLAGYSLWGFVRALLDPHGEGRSALGIGKRLVYAGSAIAYAGLLVVTTRMLMGEGPHDDMPRHAAAAVLAQPLGRWLVGITGLFWCAGAGVGEIVLGWRGGFRKRLDLTRIGPMERRWVVRLGRVGTIARGVVFAMIGWFLVSAALHADAQRAQGMDGALRDLILHPFGRILLAAVAAGLVGFGLFSILCARCVRVQFSRSPLHRRTSTSSA